jgi:hypothetical protein
MLVKVNDTIGAIIYEDRRKLGLGENEVPSLSGRKAWKTGGVKTVKAHSNHEN